MFFLISPLTIATFSSNVQNMFEKGFLQNAFLLCYNRLCNFICRFYKIYIKFCIKFYKKHLPKRNFSCILVFGQLSIMLLISYNLL